jgi:hypothetical protein
MWEQLQSHSVGTLLKEKRPVALKFLIQFAYYDFPLS